MKTYFKTTEEAKVAAELELKENFNTHLEKADHYCECGQSLSYNLIDSNTLNVLEKFIVCESCYYNH